MSGADWVDQWMRAWRAFPDAGEVNPWSVMLEQLSRSQGGGEPAFADAAARITQQSRLLLDLGHALTAASGGDWQESVLGYLDELGERLGDPEEAMRVFGGTSALASWRSFADPDRGADAEAWMGGFDALLRMPGIGPARQQQEALRELYRLWREYERAYGEYAAWCAETARRSVDRLRAYLSDRFENDDGPAGIRALYDAWAECCGQVYAERVATDDYAKLQGRLVNAFLAYRRQTGELMDEWARGTGLPTRQEVDALHRELKEMRMTLREFQAGAAPHGRETAGTRGKKRTKKKKKAAGRK
ncbi:MAG TPA: poly(R)-hydroxyalkanoic acid synthase subunit PhaE [Arenicellales bacterium]|nr:poly(R)-hydroxyalkanoic acid synthase subunit PhaE [Arenicellales bacterium]